VTVLTFYSSLLYPFNDSLKTLIEFSFIFTVVGSAVTVRTESDYPPGVIGTPIVATANVVGFKVGSARTSCEGAFLPARLAPTVSPSQHIGPDSLTSGLGKGSSP
jgi:hypothetical protein